MKRLTAIWLCALLCACLAGCAQPVPEKAADGAAWSGDWVTVGNVIGVDAPGGLELQENNEALAEKGMYYASWSIGAETPFVNAGGDSAKLYDAQVYLLLAGYDAVEKAEAAVTEWQEMAAGLYEVEHSFTDSNCNGQTYAIVTYACGSETNPYARGASAFGVYRNYAINVEIQCQEGSDVDPRAVLSSFLANCHYAV